MLHTFNFWWIPRRHRPKDRFRPSLRFRMLQVFWSPWRVVCLIKGHHWHKWACSRCLAVDEMRLHFHHVNHLLSRRRWWWERRK